MYWIVAMEWSSVEFNLYLFETFKVSEIVI